MSFRIVLATFAVSSTILLAQSKPAATLSNADRKFIEEAYQDGRTEIALGQLASQRAGNPQVRAFGEMMVKDHTQGNKELQTLAKQKGVILPAEKHESAEAKLSKLNGAAFDKAYMSDMVNDHRKVVGEFDRVSRNASDPDVRAFATKQLPTLQMHLDRAHTLHEQVNKGTADRSTPDATPTDRN